MIDERPENEQEQQNDEAASQDEGPDVTELDKDPAYNPKEAGLDGLENVRGG